MSIQAWTFILVGVTFTLYIGIAADLREPAADQWRAIFPVDELEGREVTVSVGANALRVEVD